MYLSPAFSYQFLLQLLDSRKLADGSVCLDDKYNMKTDKFRHSKSKLINRQQVEFSQVVKEMLQLHPKSEITFNEFMMLLSKFDIKFYSPEQFKKMSKIFNNTFHVLPTHTPFEYLELHSKQIVGLQAYYLVRILHKKVDIYINDASKLRASTHQPQRCMEDFVILMRKRYGSEINWFKVLGGMTVAISIEAEVFRSNLAQVMRNTSHHKCMDQIMNLLLQPQSKVITWHQFMTIVKTFIKKISEEIRSKSNKIFQRNQSHVKMHTEPCDGYLTVKSKFFTSENSKIDERPSCHSLRKQKNFSKSVYGTKKQKDQVSFFRSRCRTEGTDELDFKISTQQCQMYTKAKTSVSFGQSRDTTYPMKKHTISLPITEKRTQRNHFLWKYLKQKIQQH